MEGANSLPQSAEEKQSGEVIKLKEYIKDFVHTKSKPYIFIMEKYGKIKHATLRNIVISTIEMTKMNIEVNRLAKRYPQALFKYLDDRWEQFQPYFEIMEFLDEDGHPIPKKSKES